MCRLLHISWLWSKRWEVTKSRPVQASSNPAYILWAWPQVCGFGLLSKIWFNAQEMQFDIKQVLTKMAMLPFCYFWINLLCNPPMIRTKPKTNIFEFNYLVRKGLGTCNQVQTMLDGSCNLYQHENAMDQKWVFAKFRSSILPNHKWF